MLHDRDRKAIGEMRERRKCRRIASRIRRYDKGPLRGREQARDRRDREGIGRRRGTWDEPRWRLIVRMRHWRGDDLARQ